MAWDKSSDGAVIQFECDGCEQNVACDVAAFRRATPDSKVSDFAMCFAHVQGQGWKSFKRTGRPWTYHCATCVPEAEAAHAQYRTDEAARDRIKARNAR